jgi:hypothetical protein
MQDEYYDVKNLMVTAGQVPNFPLVNINPVQKLYRDLVKEEFSEFSEEWTKLSGAIVIYGQFPMRNLGPLLKEITDLKWVALGFMYAVGADIFSIPLMDRIPMFPHYDRPIPYGPANEQQNFIKLYYQQFATFYSMYETSGELFLIQNSVNALWKMLDSLHATEIYLGFNPYYSWQKVKDSNYSKVWPDGTMHKNEAGKYLKPDTYVAPDMNSVIDHALQFRSLENQFIIKGDTNAVQ